MPLVRRETLIGELSPPFDLTMATQLVDEFISLERRYIQRDWEPAELDGGQFAEIMARILYHQDSGNLNPRKDVADCASYIANNDVRHGIQPRTNAKHLMKVVETIYKFRSDRGAVHISPTYGPNQMDAKLVVECARWAMAEVLRLYWRDGDREAVATAIRELLQFDVPCVGKFEDVVIVQRTDLSNDEELLVLLHYAGETGLSRAELRRHARIPESSLSDALKRLTSAAKRQAVLVADRYRLTDLGSKRVREELAEKLLVA